MAVAFVVSVVAADRVGRCGDHAERSSGERPRRRGRHSEEREHSSRKEEGRKGYKHGDHASGLAL